MQAQATRRLSTFRINRLVPGALIAITLLTAAVFGVQTLTDSETAIEGQELSPVNMTQQDPPLPDDWVDPYFSSGTLDSYVQQDPSLPEGWVDPYFTQQVAIPDQQDPPLPEGWIDPYFQGH